MAKMTPEEGAIRRTTRAQAREARAARAAAASRPKRNVIGDVLGRMQQPPVEPLDPEEQIEAGPELISAVRAQAYKRADELLDVAMSLPYRGEAVRYWLEPGTYIVSNAAGAGTAYSFSCTTVDRLFIGDWLLQVREPEAATMWPSTPRAWSLSTSGVYTITIEGEGHEEAEAA